MIWAWKNLPDFEMSQANPLKAPTTRETDRISPTIAHIAQVLKHNRRTGVLGAFFSNSAFGIIRTPTLRCVTKTVSATVFLEWSVNSSLWIQGLKREDHVRFFQAIWFSWICSQSCPSDFKPNFARGKYTTTYIIQSPLKGPSNSFMSINS